MVDRVLASDLVWRIGWTLLHSVWQILLIGALVILAHALFSRRSASLRYWIACFGMATMYVPLIATFCYAPPRPVAISNAVAEPSKVDALNSTADVPAAVPFRQTTSPNIPVSAENQAPPTNQTLGGQSANPGNTPNPQAVLDINAKLPQIIAPWMHWTVGAWLFAVCLLSVWNIGGWIVVQRLKTLSTSPAAESVRKRFMQLSREMKVGRPVRLLESLRVDAPMVIGWLRPVILLPASLMTGLSAADLNAILAHELAHIRRHDYFVNLLQTFTETVLFYHPVVWFVSHRIRVEREYCCDDAAIAVCGGKTKYATALAALERSRPVPHFAMSFFGRSKNMTLQRIRRIMGGSAGFPHAWLNGGGALLLLSALLLFAVFSRSEVSAAPESVGNAAATTPPPFRLDVEYQGISDKPFPHFTFSTFPLKDAAGGNRHVEQVDAENNAAYKRITAWLRDCRFEQYAHKNKAPQENPPADQRYVLRVRSGDTNLEEDLGWDLGMLIRLDSLQLALNGGNGRMATKLDPLLVRLSGYRRQWTQSQVKGDFKASISAAKSTFPSRKPVRIKLQIENTGRENRELSTIYLGVDTPVRAHAQFGFKIYDQYGRRVPYLGGTAQFQESHATLAPGKSESFEFDLAIAHYLRKPGRYTVVNDSWDLPRSNTFAFEITPGPDDDGDPLGKLLPLLHGDWIAVANPNFQGKVQPGVNFEEVEGMPIRFQHHPPDGNISDISFVWMWLTNEKAKPAGDVPERRFPPSSKYLGKAGRWHYYGQADERALRYWPTVLEDVRKALADTQANRNEQPQEEAAVADADNNNAYRRLHDRYKMVILEAAMQRREADVARLTDEFNKSIGGRLVQVQVTPRTGPVLQHLPVLTKEFEPGSPFGKIHLPIAEQPHVLKQVNRDNGKEYVLVETNATGRLQWPGDIQIRLVLRTAEEKAAWGEIKNGLRTRLSAESTSIAAGRAVSVRLEITNVARETQSYRPASAVHGNVYQVRDEQGKAIPYLTFAGQVSVPQLIEIEPGETQTVEAFDLAAHYYLRPAGRYSVKFLGAGLPASNELAIEIKPDPTAVDDGDPIGRLLPLVKPKWIITAQPRPIECIPGSNWKETTAWVVSFLFNPTGYKGDAGWFRLMLAETPAEKQSPEIAIESSRPPGEYLGKVSRWHVYLQSTEKALDAWPTAARDFRDALAPHNRAGRRDNDVQVEDAASEVSPAAPRDGVFAMGNIYSATILELKEGRFRYWFDNDVKLKPPRAYPLTGKYSLRGDTITLENDLILAANAQWTFRKYQGDVTLWRPAALDDYQTNGKLDPYGILRSTNQTAEQIWKTRLGQGAGDPDQKIGIEPSPIVREGNISWRRQGKEKHVWVTEATDEILASLATQSDITRLSLVDGRPDGFGPAERGNGDERPGLTDDGLRHLAQMKNLQVLALPHRGITDAGMQHLKDLENLRELRLDFLPLTDAGVAHLQGLKKLKVLRFHGAPITDAGMENLRDMRDLEDLQLGRAVITDKSMPIIGNMTRLKTLDLRTKVGDDGLAHLRDLTELTWLCLDDTTVGDAGLVNLGHLAKLEWLMLENTAVTDAGLATIAKLPNITTLYLKGTSITDEGVATLARLPRLTSLDLSGTRITDAAIDTLARQTRLESLKLDDTKLTDSGLTKLQGLMTLNHLEIRRTPSSLQAIEKLRAANPKLKVYADRP